MTSLEQLPPALEFSPDNVQWFHAVNSESKLVAAISTIKQEHQKFHSQSKAASASSIGGDGTVRGEPWFGIEVDIRTTANTLILSHDPPVVGYVSNLLGRAFGLHTMLQMVQANLLEGGGGGAGNTTTLPPPALIIKLDVKDQDSLNALSRDIVTSLLENGANNTNGGTNGASISSDQPHHNRGKKLIPPQLFIHCYASANGEVPRTQVWLNYDVIPYSLHQQQQQPPFDLSLVTPFKDVASALQKFHATSQQETPKTGGATHSSIGFSLGWISTAEGGRYKPNAVTAGLPIYLSHHYTAMLEFLKKVFPSKSATANKKEEIGTPPSSETAQPRKLDLSILTFALRFSLVDYGILRQFFQDLEAYWKSSEWDQEENFKIFPTLWRGRTEVISDATRKALEEDARLHKTIACVDQE